MINLTSDLCFKIESGRLRKSGHDFIRYCHDIEKIESGIFLESDHYFGLSYGEIIQLALRSLPGARLKMQDSAFCVIGYEGYDFDPPYAHVSAYIKDVLGLMMPCLVLQPETSAIYTTAFHFLDALLQKGEKGCLLHVYQACLPFCSKKELISSDENFIHFFFFEGV